MFSILPPPQPVVFDLTEWFSLFIDYFAHVVAWSKVTVVSFGIVSFSYYDLFFSAWAVMLVCSWIPVLSDFFEDGGDKDFEDDPGYFWYD